MPGDFTVELERYLGLWHEYARTPNRPQDRGKKRGGRQYGGCLATTADYCIAGPNRIALRNCCRREANDGSTIIDCVRGIARLQRGSRGRRFKIAFGPWAARCLQRALSFGGFGYWIYGLGPVNDTGLYDWAVISGPRRNFIFLLTRSPQPPLAAREAMVKNAADAGLPVQALSYRR